MGQASAQCHPNSVHQKRPKFQNHQSKSKSIKILRQSFQPNILEKESEVSGGQGSFIECVRNVIAQNVDNIAKKLEPSIVGPISLTM